MKVGLFDHVEHVDNKPLSTLFDERLRFAAAADEAGIWGYHLAEHHCSPLNMVPVPGIFLGALARETRQIRIGTLVYLLTLVSPLKMIEEISMVDQLSGGRMEVGVGRGVSPYELGYHKIDFDQSRDIFIDAYNCLVAGLTSGETFSYEGKHYTYKDVPMWLRPHQKPYPAFWYGSSNTTGATWAGENGLHFTANGPIRMARENIAAYRTALARRGGVVQPKSEFPGGAVIGALRQIVVADTDKEAERIARPAVGQHLLHRNWLRQKHGFTDLTNRLRNAGEASYDDVVKEGVAIVGTPETVLREIERQNKELGGINYLIGYMMFGSMPLPDALRSLDLFCKEVMPKLSAL
ncbi:MAG: LLM class flavin-dependent oxidoreductase [Hyphomicrobiaceae bacterium]